MLRLAPQHRDSALFRYDLVDLVRHEASLALDHGAPGERQGCTQVPRLSRFMIGRNQRRQRHFNPSARRGR